MRKYGVLLLLSFVPSAVGYCINHTMALFIPLPFNLALWQLFTPAFSVFWVLLGRRWDRAGGRFLPGLLLLHGVSFLSMGLYVYECILLDDNAVHFGLASFSQLFASPLLIPSARIIGFFYRPNVYDSKMVRLMVSGSLLLLLALFLAGFVWGKLRPVLAEPPAEL